jgi:hypothetical protein
MGRTVGGSNVGKGKRFFSSVKRRDRFWGPPSLLFNGHRDFFPGGIAQWRTQEFCWGGGGVGVQQIQLRTEDRENGDLGAVAP